MTHRANGLLTEDQLTSAVGGKIETMNVPARTFYTTEVNIGGHDMVIIAGQGGGPVKAFFKN